jgi:hypothetical protein
MRKNLLENIIKLNNHFLSIYIVIMVKTIYVTPIKTDSQLEKKEGDYFPISTYNKIIDYDCDVYCQEKDQPDRLLLKFRKNVLNHHSCTNAFNGLKDHAQQKNRNRGAASGKLNINKLPNYVGKITKKHSFRVFYKNKDGKMVKDNIGNVAMSNIAGYYDRPDRNEYTKMKQNGKTLKNIPMCRTTSFTAKEVDKWKQCLPLIQEADLWFKNLVPDRHKIQLARAKKTRNYQILDTAYSTITVNYNWRTAMHKDVGDLHEGFGNLIVLEKHKSDPNDNTCNYIGGYLGFPKWGVCVDVRQGDFLAMDVHEFHANTPISGEKKGCEFGRLSVVCYLREKMIKCL